MKLQIQAADIDVNAVSFKLKEVYGNSIVSIVYTEGTLTVLTCGVVFSHKALAAEIVGVVRAMGGQIISYKY